METVLFLFGGIANIVAAIGGALSAVFLGWVGIQWMMASGDVQKLAQARSSLIGTLVGLCILGLSFLIPDAINQRLLRPTTGVDLTGVVGASCDNILRNQLVRNRQADDPFKMNTLVRQIQAARDGCDSEVWSPVVSIRVGSTSSLTRPCYRIEVGQTDIPAGLKMPGSPDAIVRARSGRDEKNNVVVHFSDSDLPADNSACWLYHSRLKIWDQDYARYAPTPAVPVDLGDLIYLTAGEIRVGLGRL